MEIDVARDGSELCISARGSREERPKPHRLDPERAADVSRFADGVREGAARRRPLGPLLEAAHSLHREVLRDDLAALLSRLREAAEGEPLLLRLALREDDLHAVPWEALCAPGEALGFLASSPDLLPVRGVTTTEPWQPRAVRGALRVLAVAPTGGASLAALKAALSDRIKTGEVEWLDPLEGPAASATGIFERLRREPVPHVLHFVGHGGIENGSPALRLADTDDGDESWLPVELLAQQLKANLRGFLRLVVLECCEGARPSVFASAAEILGRAGADAVVAHLWPVRADVARAFSGALYRALAGTDRSKGDIAISMNEARRAILGAFEGSAEAFSPVVYLRGPDGVIFDFKGRTITLPSAVATSATSATSRGGAGAHLSIGRLLERPFSLVVGDRSRQQRQALGGFRDKLQKDLAKSAVSVPPQMSMSAIAQRFALHRGDGKLSAEFQKAFRGATEPPPFIAAFTRLIRPGVHITLLRHPWIELCLAEQQPERTIYLIQHGDENAMIVRREGGQEDWEEQDSPPAAIDVDEDVVLLRPYGGYTPEQVFARPLLTEDDYVLGIGDIDRVLPQDIANTVFSTLSYRPALLLGLSLHTSHHRMLLYRLFPRGVPRGSVAVIDPEDGERALWEKGSGLPGKGEGVEVLEMSLEELGAALASDEGGP